MRKVFQLSFLTAVILLGVFAAACAPAATPAPTAAPPTVAPKPTDVPKPTVAQPTTVSAAPTTAPTAAPAATSAPAPTATPPPPVCTKMADAPAAPAAGALGSSTKPIVIVFVPSGDVPTITKAGNGTADCLTQMTGLTYKIQVATANSAAIEALGAGQAQFSFLNTFSVLLARQKYQVVPLLVAARKYATVDIDPDKGMKDQLTTFYKGQFLTKKDSGIKTIADLKGKTFCFTDPTSTSGTIIPQLVLKANGINPDKDLKGTTFAGSHPNVADAVYKGDCDAGAAFIDVRTDAAVQKAHPDILDKVSPFFVTDRIPNDGLQSAKEVDPKIQTATVNAILAMFKDPGGKALIKSAYSYDAMEKVEPTFYDAFRDLMVKAGADPAQFVK